MYTLCILGLFSTVCTPLGIYSVSFIIYKIPLSLSLCLSLSLYRYLSVSLALCSYLSLSLSSYLSLTISFYCPYLSLWLLHLSLSLYHYDFSHSLSRPCHLLLPRTVCLSLFIYFTLSNCLCRFHYFSSSRSTVLLAL